MNIYVGNLSSDVTEEDLRTLFEAHGQVSSINIIKDRFSGEPRGFGFVEMPSNSEAKEAVSHLNGTELKGRAIRVEEARPRSDRGRGRGGPRQGRGYRRQSW